uniref:Transmembrane protein n=1 Tax=Steinernema glaseri TaxID=37863 RepID=A0A1I7ZVQ0_9BILA
MSLHDPLSSITLDKSCLFGKLAKGDKKVPTYMQPDMSAAFYYYLVSVPYFVDLVLQTIFLQACAPTEFLNGIIWFLSCFVAFVSVYWTIQRPPHETKLYVYYVYS